MESRNEEPPSTAISDLLTLSEIEEDNSYEDLDQLLNSTTIENNYCDDPDNNTTTANNDIVEILQSVTVSTLLQHGNLNLIPSGATDESKSPTTTDTNITTGSNIDIMVDKILS